MTPAFAAAAPPSPTGKPGDFDFLSGQWKIKNRQLKKGVWDQFDGERTYRLASILALKGLGRSFKRPRSFDLARSWQASVARFEAELRELQAQVRVSPRGLKWLSNGRIRVLKLPAGTSTKTTRSGWCELLLLIESIEHGARQLLSFGAEVEVIEPAALSSAMLKQARGVVALYPRTAR